MDAFKQAYIEKIDIFDEKLSRMLGQQFLFNRDDQDVIIGLTSTLSHPISHRFLEIISLLQAYQDYEAVGDVSMAQDRLHRLYESYFKLELLVRDLERIKEYDITLLNDFAQMLLKSDEDNYYGDRLEIQIASLLVKLKVPFEKSESPDLSMTWHGCKIGIECTSVHYKGARPQQLSMQRKIGRAINAKARKPYAGENIAILIDITNVHSFGTNNGNLLEAPNSLKNYLTHKINQTKYGSVILCTYEYQHSPPSLSWAYARRGDATDIDPELKNLLDEVFGASDETFVLQDATVPSTV